MLPCHKVSRKVFSLQLPQERPVTEKEHRVHLSGQADLQADLC